MTLRRILFALSATCLLSAHAQADYSVHQVPLIYFRADQFFPANRQYIHGDYFDPNGEHLITPPADNGRDVQEGPLSVNEISQIKNIIRERQPITTEDPNSQRQGRNQDLSQNFNPDLYTSGDPSQNGFQDNAQPNFGENFPNNGQPGPNFQNNGQPGFNFPNGQPGPNFPANGQPGPNFQNNGQPGPNFQNNGQPGNNFPNNGQPGPNFPFNTQPGNNFQNNGQPGLHFPINGQPGPNFQNNGQFNFPNNGQPGPNFQNGQNGPNFPLNGQPGPNFPSNGQPGPIFSNNGLTGPSIVSPAEQIDNHSVITEFPAPLTGSTEAAPPPSVTVSDIITSSKVYQDNSYAPPPPAGPEGNALHVSHHVVHHEAVRPRNNPLHLSTEYGAPPKNTLESLPEFPTPPTPAGPPHPQNNQGPHFSGPFPHPEAHHFDLSSGPFSQNDRVNIHFAGHGPSEFSDFSGNGINAVYGPFDANFLQQNPIILNNADTFFTQQLPNFPLFPHSNYEQNRFIFPQGFPQPSSLPLADSNFPEFPAYPPGTSVHNLSNPGDVITSSTPSHPNSPSSISQSPDSFTAQPPPSQQLAIPNGPSF